MRSSTSEKKLALRLVNVCKSYPKRLKSSVHDRVGLGLLLNAFFRPEKSGFDCKSVFHALDNINLSLYKGESLGIVGLNGSGKSTLLQIISGTLKPSSGNVEVNGKVGALLELGSGFNSDFSGKENIFLNASLLGLSKAEINQKMQDIEKFADIGEFMNQPVKTYSSGMVLRVAFAVIAHSMPDILIIDEALAVGDAKYVQKCMRFLREFKKHGTLILVSHDISAIRSLCNRCLWLQKGRISENGDAKKVSESYLGYILSDDSDIVENPKENRELKKDSTKSLSMKVEGNKPYFKFNSDSSDFGSHLAKIENISLLNAENKKSIQVLQGTQLVELRIFVRCFRQITEPIVGFFIRDSLGQDLFGDNTWKKYMDTPLLVNKDSMLMAKFNFQMPILPQGEYSITVAIAEGDQKVHQIHHWMHDAMIIKSISSSPTGLVGIEMNEIELLVE